MGFSDVRAPAGAGWPAPGSPAAPDSRDAAGGAVSRQAGRSCRPIRVHSQGTRRTERSSR